MTTPAPKKTSLTDLDNVMWVIERPPPAATADDETVASVGRGPRMTAYSALLAAVAGDPDFTEGKVKRDSKGRFSKKAGAKSAATEPAKKTAAPAASAPPTSTAASGGKKMTNKIIYGKHANGTIIEASDGQHRMVFNAAGNNWTVQRRTPDGGWEVIDVLGKGAAYKKANELSALWGDPHDGTTEELEPAAPATDTASGPFAPGWNDLSGSGLTPFKTLQVLTSAKTQLPNPSMSPGLMVQTIANIAQTHNIAPEHVVALLDENRGDTAFSDAVQAELNGGPFPTSIYPSAAAVKKAAVTYKKVAKKTAAPMIPTPTVAPAPIAKKIAAKKTAAKKTFSADNAPATLVLKDEPYDINELTAQANASAKLSKIYDEMLAAYNAGDTAQGDEIADDFDVAMHNYSQTYGTTWAPKHAAKVATAYQEALDQEALNLGGAPSSTPATPPAPPPIVTIPGANPGVGMGAKVKVLYGDVGNVIGTSTLPNGSLGLIVQVVGSGEIVNLPIGDPVAISDENAEALASVPPVGTKIAAPSGTFTVMGDVNVDATGTMFVKMMTPKGNTVWKKASEVEKMMATAAGLGVGPSVGSTVSTPDGEGTVTNTSPGGAMVQVKFPSGAITMYSGSDVSEVSPPPTPTATSAITPGTAVSTPYGNGSVLSSHNDDQFYVVEYADGSVSTFEKNKITPITPATPPVTLPTPPPPPTMTYDADGVPILTGAQQIALTTQFQDAGVNWYNSTDSIFDAAYAASQATGMSVEDVLKYADANFHKSSKFDGKPFQAKVEKWAKSSKGKAHIQAKIGAAAASITPVTPASPPSAAAVLSTTGGADDSIADVAGYEKIGAYTQFTTGFTTLATPPDELAQKAANVADKLDLTPMQVLKIVDEQKAAEAGVPNGNLFENAVLAHLAGSPFPAPAPPLPAFTPSMTPTSSGYAPFPVNADNPMVGPSGATAMQHSMTVANPPPWTSSQVSALISYTGSGYMEMNECLRNGTDCTPSVQTRIMNASAAMRPTTQPITVFRGAPPEAFGVDSAAELDGMIGDIVSDEGFSSTSIDPETAFSQQVSMQIEVPAGARAAYLANISKYPSEQELLLAPGTRYRILEVIQDPGGHARVRVEVVLP